MVYTLMSAQDIVESVRLFQDELERHLLPTFSPDVDVMRVQVQLLFFRLTEEKKCEVLMHLCDMVRMTLSASTISVQDQYQILNLPMYRMAMTPCIQEYKVRCPQKCQAYFDIHAYYIEQVNKFFL